MAACIVQLEMARKNMGINSSYTTSKPYNLKQLNDFINITSFLLAMFS